MMATGLEQTRGGQGGGQRCLGHGQIFGQAKQLFCLLVLLLVFGCDPTSGDMVRFVGCDTVKIGRLDPPLQTPRNSAILG